jgi:hypothetical protein
MWVRPTAEVDYSLGLTPSCGGPLLGGGADVLDVAQLQIP